jgi:hypothetical protein
VEQPSKNRKIHNYSFKSKLYVAHVLDPRTKFKALQYSLVKCSGPE